MYVYEEMVDGKKLSEIINTEHENVKYLPGHRLPENIVAEPDLLNAARDADILIFVLPHAFVSRICKPLKDVIKPDTIGISLIKVCVNSNVYVNSKTNHFFTFRVLVNFQMVESSLFPMLFVIHSVSRCQFLWEPTWQMK